ncbi:MAG TPA: hypothetical protein DEO82_04450 [Eubacterium sp.]|nr:hypothetical protein [Eubacterium sp.]
MQSVDEDFEIIEYNSSKRDDSNVRLNIYLDSSDMPEISYKLTPEILEENTVSGEGWYKYRYVIAKENFKKDGVYNINLTTRDEAGNVCLNDRYAHMDIEFRVDATKPELSSVLGLNKTIYNAENVKITYKIFDFIGLKSVKVYIDKALVDEVEDFYDITSYEGSFEIKEGTNQNIRFIIEDIAGNITDTDKDEDFNSAKVAEFKRTVTVSTNFFVRFVANKPLMYGSISGMVAMVALGTGIGIKRRRRKVKNG